MNSSLLSRLFTKRSKTIISVLLTLAILIPSLAFPGIAQAVPLAPTTLTAVVTAGTRNIVLTWNDPALGVELGFYVYKDTVNTFNSVNLIKTQIVGPSAAPVAPATTWTGTFTEVATVSGGTFFYKVTAYDVTGESGASNVVTLVVPSAAPTLLTAVATANTRNTVLNWTSNSFGSELGFYIYRDTVTTFNSPNLKVSSVGPAVAPVAPAVTWTQTYTDVAGVAGGTYFYRVVAYDLKGQSTPSNNATVTKPAAIPTGLTGTLTAGTADVNLRWTSTSAGTEDGFYISADTVNTFNSANLMQASVGRGITTFTITPVVTGVTWFFRVTAFDLTGQTGPSNVWSIAVPNIVTVPANPSNLVATVMTTTRIDLTWTDNAIDETAYRVQRATNATFTNGLTNFNLAAGATTYSNTTAQSNTTYYYRVTCSNAGGTSGPSNVVQTRTAVPTGPTGVTAVAAGPTQVNLTWVAPAIPNQTSFRIDRATNTGFTANLVTVNNVARNLTTYSDTTVAAATAYYYRVYAVNGIGNSAASATAGPVTTLVTPVVPPAPTGLTAVAASATQVELSWTVNGTPTSLRVERSTAADFSAGLVSFPMVTATTATYSDTTTVKLTTYYYRVIATNAVGDSAPSISANVTTPDVVPTQSSNLTATVVTPNVRLDWTDNSNNETGFVIQRATDNAFTAGLTPFNVGAGIITYLDLTAAPSTTYFYRVYATNGIGNSGNSNVVSASTVAIGAPVAPSGLAAVAPTTTSVNVSWTNNDANQSGVRLERATDAAFTANKTIYTLAANATTYADTVLPNMTYFYRIFATNSFGDSLPSATVSVATSNAIPMAPTVLTATLTNSYQIDISWIDNSTNESGFRIYTALDSAFTKGFVTIDVPANTINFSDTTVYPGDTFYYKITAFNSVGESAPSNVTSVVIVLDAQVVPAAPSGLTATLLAGNQVDLDWIDNSPVEAGYVIERALDDLFTTGLTTFMLPAYTATFSDMTALPSLTYYYRVMAFNYLGNSLPSNTATVTTAAIVVATPTDLRGDVSGATQISLSWTDNAINETGYTVERATDAAFTVAVVSYPLGPNSNAFTNDTTVVSGTTYFYRVIATNAAGNSAPSNVISVRAGVPLAPSGVTGTGTGPTTTNLTWVDNANNELTYQVQRASVLAFNIGVTTFTLPANSTTYADSGLMKLTTYYYRVLCANAAGSSPTSPIVTVVTLDNVPPPLGSLVATATQATRIVLTWTNATPTLNTSIRIERGSNPAFTGTITTFTTGAATITYTDATAVANTTYYYRVFAVNATGPSSTSNTASATTPATTPGAVPAAPTGLTATLINSGQINLAWTHNGTNLGGFNLETTSDPTFLLNMVVIPLASNLRAYSDFTVYPGATFYYRIKAVNVLGQSGNSNTVPVTVPAATVVPPALAPSGLNAVVISNTELTLNWVDNATNETGFLLYRATNTTFTTGLTSFAIGANTATYLDDTVSPGIQYYYRICSYNTLGVSAMSGAIAAATIGSVIPAAPTNLAAAASSATQITLNWIDNANNETGYRVEQSTDAAFTANLVTFPLAAGTITYNAVGLTQLSTYFFRVFAVNAVGDSIVSNTASAATLSATAPATPTALTATLISNARIDLRWTLNGTAETSVLLERATDSGFTTGLTPISLLARIQTYSDTTVTLNNVYYYRVSAINPSGASATSTTVSVNMNPPSTPVGVTATAISATRIDLAWTSTSATADGFQIDRAANNTFNAGLVTFFAPAGATTYSDITAISNTAYFYRIQAFNSILGNSAFSAPVPVTSLNVAPAAPLNLTALTVSPARIDLVWNRNGTNETGFRLERALDTAFTSSPSTFNIGAGVQFFSDVTTSTATTYYYRIYAVNAAGDSPASNTATATTPDMPPSACTGFTATLVNAYQIDLSWTNNHVGPVSHRIERATNAAFTAWLTTFNVPSGASTYSDATAVPSTRYYYRIISNNAAGSSPPSNVATVATPDVPPLAPSSVIAQAISYQRVDISWVNNATNQTGFRVQRADDAGFTTNVVDVNVGALVLSYSDTTVVPLATYHYRVFATNAGNATPSTGVSVTVPPIPAPGAADAPSNLVANAVGTTWVNLDWTDNALLEDGFRIERAPDVASTPGVFAVIGTVGANVTTYSDNNPTDLLTAATTYHYRVIAFNVTGSSPYSNVASVTTASNPAFPTAPTGVNAVFQMGPPRGILVSWTITSTNQVAILLMRANNSTFTLNLMTWTLPASTTSYLDTAIASGNVYFYKVVALGSASPPSGTVGVVIPPMPPADPTGLTAQAISTTQVNLAWTDNANDETGYRVERATNDTFTSALTTFTLGANAISYSDTAVAASTAYFYRVYAFNDGGDSLASNTANVTTPANPTVPAAPSNLTASPVSPTRIDLSWADNSGNETGFNIERSPDNTFLVVTTTAVGAGTTTFTDTPLTAGTAYFYRVYSFNVIGPSVASNTASATTPNVPPVATTGLGATVISATQINLAWTDNSNNETGFRIERATNSAFSAGLTTFNANANATSYNDIAAAASTAYYYRVFTVNASGASPASATVTATTPGMLPGAPSNVTAIAASSTSVNVSWADNASNETGFRIERATNSAFSAGLTSGTVAANVLAYTDNTAAGAMTYFYRVFATNVAGDSAASNTATVTTPTTIPAAPSVLTATVVNSTRVDLAWTNNASNQTGFTLQRATDAGFGVGLTTFNITSPTATTYSDTTVVPSTTYFYQIYAVNAAGSSTASNSATAATAVTIPNAPTVAAATTITQNQVNITWTDNSQDESGFRVERATDTAFTVALMQFSVAANVTLYSDISAAPGTAYNYRVIAFNTAGDSTPSNTSTVTTAASAVLAPTGLTANVMAANQVDLAWTSTATGLTGFRVERATDTAFTIGLAQFLVTAGTFAYSDTTTAGTTTYYFRVIAYDATGDSPASNVVTIITPNALAPAAPSALTATAISGTQVNLTWANNAVDQAGFRVERATDAAFTVALVQSPIADPLAVAYSDTTALPLAAYYYRVFATNAAGDSIASNSATVTMPNVVPAAPTLLTGTAVSGTQVDLAWTNNATNQTGFRVERATDTAFTVGLVSYVIATATTVTYSDIAASPNTTYYYRVFATNAIGDSLASNTATVTTLNIVPAAPSGLIVLAITGTRVDLFWTYTNANQTGFKVDRATDVNFTAGLVSFTITDPLAVNYSDTTAAALTTYYYRVFATNAVGPSLASNTASTPTPAAGAPTAPSGLTASAVTGPQVILIWANNATTQTGFRVERATDAAFTTGLTPFIIASATALTYTDTTPAASTLYYYRVFATNVSGNSLASNVASVTTTTGGPTPPANLTAVKVTDTRIDLTWSDMSNDELGFRIESDEVSTFNGPNNITFQVAAGVTTYSDTSVFAGTTFYYRVTSYNASGTSAPSNVANVNIPLPTPGVPISPNGLTATVVNTNQVDLAWNDNSTGETGFLIERATNSSFSAGITAFTTAGNVTTYSDMAIPNGTYYYRVKAFNAIGNSGDSASVTVTIGSTSSGTGTGTGGGFGGGGFAPIVPTTTVAVTGFTADSTPPKVDNTGVVKQIGILQSTDQQAKVVVPENTKMLDSQGKPLANITCDHVKAPPAPPANNVIVSDCDFGPDGATFNPPITVTLKYNPATLPAGVNPSELKIAFWDGSQWQILAGTVNLQTNEVSAPVSHFTSFTILSPTPPPPPKATFSVSNMLITPKTPSAGQTVTVYVNVTNTSAQAGSYDAVLKINSAIEETKKVDLAAGASAEVSFSFTKATAGTYNVEINGLSSSFAIAGAPQVTPPTSSTPTTTPTSSTPTQTPISTTSPITTPISTPVVESITTGFNWWIIVAIGGAIVVGIIGGWLVLRNRGKKEVGKM